MTRGFRMPLSGQQENTSISGSSKIDVGQLALNT